MSVNIQTANGLVRVSGTNDYNELKNAPNIKYDSSNNLVVSDKNGNSILQANTSGVTTTSVFADTVVANGEDVIAKIEGHSSDTSVHVTTADKQKWNNKSDFSGSFNDLDDKPNISDDGTGELRIEDNSGNAILKVDATGLTTTDINAKTVNADEVIANGENLTTKIDNHASDNVKHITSAERTAWNNKSDLGHTHYFNDLENKPNIADDGSGELKIEDPNGNAIFKVDSTGTTTTNVYADGVYVNGEELGAKVSAHVDNSTIHVTSTDKTKWNGYEATINALPTKDYVDSSVDTAVANLVNQAPETLNTLDELSAALGDDPNFATTVAAQIGQKADKTELHSHSNKSVLDEITAERVADWDTTDYYELENRPNVESDSEEKELRVIDKDGYTIMLADKDGVHTTNFNATNNFYIGTLDILDTLNTYLLDIDESALVTINTAQVLG